VDNVLQISEGTNSVGIVRLDLGFCLCAVIASSGLLTIKLKKMEREKQALNRRLAKAGLTDQDVAEEVEREATEDEAKKTTQDESKENAENAENTEKGKDVEKIEAELKEIEVVKYKMQEDMIALRKDYEHQMEILNFKVNLNHDNLESGFKLTLTTHD